MSGADTADIERSEQPARRGLGFRRHAALALVFLAALGFRGVYLAGQARNNPLFNEATMDPGIHHEWAQQIASGHGMGDKPYFRAPLYYYLLAGLYKLVGPSLTAGRIAGIILGALTCYLIARLGVLLAGLGPGLLAGFIAAFYWPFVYFDSELLTVGLEVFLDVTLLILLWQGARRGALLLFLAAGVVWGLSAITRPTILALAPVVVVWPWIAPRNGERRLRRFPAAALACLGAALAVAPVTIRNYVVGDELVLVATNGGVNFFIGNNPHSDGFSAVVPGTRPGWQGGYIDTHRIAEVDSGRKLAESEVSDYWYGKAWEWIGSHPGDWLAHTLHKLRLFWSPREIPNNRAIWPLVRMSEISVLFWIGFPVVACLGVAGMILLLPQWRTWFLPLGFFVIYTATVVAFFCPARYRLPVVPVLIVAAGAGLFRLVESLTARRRWRLPVYVLAGGLCATAVATNPPRASDFEAFTEAEAHYALGLHCARSGPDRVPDHGKAIEHFQSALVLQPRFLGARLALGYSLHELKQFAQARRQFAAAVDEHPNSAEARLYLGDVLSSTGKPAEAIKEYQAALRVEPWNAEAHERLGILLTHARRNEEAIRFLRTALKIQPDLTPARHSLARALANQGELEEAVAQLQAVVKAEPANPTALQDVAGLLAKLGRSEQAIAHLYEALRLAPQRPDISESLATLLRNTGRHAEAIDVLKAATQRLPDNTMLLSILSWLLATAPEADLRDGQRALELAQRAEALSPDHPHPGTLDALAAAYAELGRYDDAVGTGQRALERARETAATQLAGQIEARLRLYRQGQPYRELHGD